MRRKENHKGDKILKTGISLRHLSIKTHHQAFILPIKHELIPKNIQTSLTPMPIQFI